MTRVEVTGAAVPRLSRSDTASFARKILLKLGRLDEISAVSIALVNNATMRNLNRTFRKKNKTTDVLTFPGDRSFEIIISIDRARRQAEQERHSLATEIRYLILHGILHGLGYDHERDHGQMDALEMKVRETVGLD